MSDAENEYDFGDDPGVPRGEGESWGELAERRRAERETTPSEQWTQKAGENVEKWGQQSPAEYALALAEELAEVCEVILATADPGDGESPVGDYDETPHRGRELLVEQQHLGFEIRDYLEGAFEDDEGVPIPVDERPAITGDLRDPDAAREEIDDLGALAIQMCWALGEEGGDE